ncbi:MAG TPA: hypothetical protein DCM54_07595 [Gammaproteobacteria bacterium]|nr:hypothetical protein [Gammaproteobacteria bacterium]
MHEKKLSTTFQFFSDSQISTETHLLLIGVGVLLIVGTAGSVFYKMTLVRNIMNNSVATDFTAQSRISEHMFHIAQIYLVGFVAFAIASFIFSLMVSHRIAGPVVAITAYIEELNKGNFDYGRNLRPGDELTIIMDALHDLKESLKNNG